MSALPMKLPTKELNVPEFFKIYTSISICIKHPYHHLDRMHIKARKVPIDQRLPQLSLRQLAYPLSINSFKKREE